MAQFRAIEWPYGAWEQAMCCPECAVRVLLLMLKSPEWVLRRVERVSFHDDRTAKRRVSTDFSVPELAPCYRVGEDAWVRLVPLTVMRRKTLVNFGLTDAEGKTLSLVSMRHNQVLTEQIVLALADITPEVRRSSQLKEFARHLARGTQQQLRKAFKDAKSGQLGPDVSRLLADRAAALLLRRLANNFILLITVDDVGSPRRIVRFFYDEPLTLTYKQSRYDPNTGSYGGAAEPLSVRSLASLAAATGWSPTVIRFPIPAAENTLSYHFEIEAPEGVLIASASLVAGRPNGRRKPPSWDHVEGGFPVVGLHVCDVPNGSLSAAQVELRLSRRGWLTASLLASVVSAALLWITVMTADRVQGHSPQTEAAATTLLTITAAFLAFVARPAEHQMGSRLVTSVRRAAAISMVLLIAVGSMITFYAPSKVVLGIMVVGATGCAVLVLLAWILARPSHTQISPWEQGLALPKGQRFKTLEEAREAFGFNQPAVLVASSEGDHRKDFRWTRKIETDLINRLVAALPQPEPTRVTARQNADDDHDGSGRPPSPHRPMAALDPPG